MARIITFYSYKGGTGRSMALANVAWILASNGKRVIAIDWDLEAPGLHRYFRPFLVDKELSGQESQGVIDMVLEYARRAAAPPPPGEAVDTRWYEKHADFSKWKKRLRWPSGDDLRLGPDGRGSIDFVPAGRQDTEYAQKVNSFDWRSFYDKLNGGAFLDAARRKFGDYDYVLIDSRTGVSDTSGICTVHLPDTVVICFTLNFQSINGAAGIASSIRGQRPDVRLWPVPMRIDGSEEKLLGRMKRYSRLVFSPVLDSSVNADQYWFSMEVPYSARYAYAEKLSLFEEQTSITASTLPSMELLTGFLTAESVRNARALPEEPRRAALREYEWPPVPEVEASPQAAPIRVQEKVRLEVSPRAAQAAWSAYRVFDATAAFHRRAIDRLQRSALSVTVGGAVVVAVQSAQLEFRGASAPMQVLYPAAAAGCIFFGAYVSVQTLAENRQLTWLRCRSAAESVKSALFLYRTGVPPFADADRQEQLFRKLQGILDDTKGIEMRPSDENPPPMLDALDVRQYISVRVDAQIQGYQARAHHLRQTLQRAKRVIMGFGVLAAITALVNSIWELRAVSAWIGVLATIAVAVTAYTGSQRHQTLIDTYSATALRLQLLRDQWIASGKSDSDKADRDAFIQNCENTIAIENGAWVDMAAASKDEATGLRDRA
jgi:cellulose biosynthesis protein BcsQ